MSLQIEHLTKFYGKQAALNDVSFSLRQGEIVGFLGPNGAGKSTLMKIATGYLAADSGSVTVCGNVMSETNTEARRLVGYLPEHNPLYPDLYVKEYLLFVAGMYKLGRQKKSRVDEMIELTGLTREYKKRIGQLSKGYRQRVGLAQALIHNPQALILDEPTTGLDPNQLEEIRSLIVAVGKEKTVLLSTHIMQEVEAICGRVIIIDNGKLVADNTEKELQHRQSQNRWTAVVEFASPVDVQLLKAILHVLEVEMPEENHYKITSEKDIRADLFHFAEKNGLTLLTLRQEEQNMEAIFKQLTGNDK